MNHHNILIQAKQDYKSIFFEFGRLRHDTSFEKELANVLAHALLVFHLAVTLK